MITISTNLGAGPVLVHSPGPGEPAAGWLPALHSLIPPGTPQLLGLDVETRWMDGAGQWSADFAVRTLQLGTEHEAWVLRLDDIDQARTAASILSDPSKEFVSHTDMDPSSVLVQFGIDISNRFLNTHPLAVMCAPDDRAGQADLKRVAARLGMPELKQADKALDGVFEAMYRAEHPELGRRAVAAAKFQEAGFNTVDPADPTFVAYAGLDAIAVRRAGPLLLGELAAIGTPAPLLEAELWLMAQAAQIKATGFRIDQEALEAVERHTGAQEARARSELEAITGGLRPTQGKKLVDWWDDQITGGWPADHPRTEKGAVQLGDNQHHRLKLYAADGRLSEAGLAAYEAYDRHIEVANRLTVAAQVRRALDPAGRIHPTLNSVGAVTGRSSSSGPNQQNFAKPEDPTDPAREARGMVLPDPGEVFISCDFAQVEYRVAAALSREPDLVNTILSGGNLHKLTATKLAIPVPRAKRVNFGVLYGSGGARLAKILQYDITEEEGRQTVADYWAAYPMMADLRKRTQEEALAAGGVRLMSGRLVRLGKYENGQPALHVALNYLIQGNARELLVGAWMRVVRQYFSQHPEWNARVRFPIHDELLVSCKEEYAQDVCAALVECMSFDFLGVPITAEADILLDELGVSRWMSGDLARKIREEKAA